MLLVADQVSASEAEVHEMRESVQQVINEQEETEEALVRGSKFDGIMRGFDGKKRKFDGREVTQDDDDNSSDEGSSDDSDNENEEKKEEAAGDTIH
jgi:hypothetical protein